MDFHEIAEKTDNLLSQVVSADVRVPEDSALISLARDLVPTVTRLLEEGLQLMDDIDVAYSPDRLQAPQEDDPFSLKGIGFMISSVFASRDLTDLAFFAHTDGCGRLLFYFGYSGCLFYLDCGHYMPRDNCRDIRLCVTESDIPEFYTLLWQGVEPKMVCHDVFSYWRFEVEQLHLFSMLFWESVMFCAAFEDPSETGGGTNGI